MRYPVVRVEESVQVRSIRSGALGTTTRARLSSAAVEGGLLTSDAGSGAVAHPDAKRLNMRTAQTPSLNLIRTIKMPQMQGAGGVDSEA
jgi:hypothetical protein